MQYTNVIRFQCDKCLKWAHVVAESNEMVTHFNVAMYAPLSCLHCGDDDFHVVTVIDISDYANKQAQEIETLKQALVETQAALTAQSEAIAMHKQFAHIVLAYAEDGNLYHLQVIARGVLGDSGAANATAEAPQQAVTLTDTEIDWLIAHHVTSGGAVMVAEYETITDAQSLFLRYVEDYRNMRQYQIAAEYDTPANRAAIEARRKKSE